MKDWKQKRAEVISMKRPKSETTNLYYPNYRHITFPVPRRTDAPWCSECGMTLPAHWPGCPNGPERPFDPVEFEENEVAEATRERPSARPVPPSKD
jgi:hypothetical protein